MRKKERMRGCAKKNGGDSAVKCEKLHFSRGIVKEPRSPSGTVRLVIHKILTVLRNSRTMNEKGKYGRSLKQN